MPCEITLESDFDRGLDRYTVTLGDDFDSRAAHELCDWLTAAAQNPTAVFTIDVSHTPRGRSRPVATVLTRCAWLRARRRVDIVRRGLVARTAPLALAPLEALLPPLS